MKLNIPGAKDGEVYVNTPYHGIDSKKRVYCPLCYYDLREVTMVFSERHNAWICNYCKYETTNRQNPIENSVLTAGNEESNQRPYMRTIDVNRNKKGKIAPNIFKNAAESWEN